jgi:hypothetical protein
MTDVFLLWLALMLWQMRYWDEISYDEKAISFREKVWRVLFRTPKLDRRINEWLGDAPEGESGRAR